MSKNPTEKSLGMWLVDQQQNYKKNQGAMVDPEIRKLWEDFVEKYKFLFMSSDEKWDYTMGEICKFTEKNGRKPSASSKDETEKSLGSWIYNQQNKFVKNQGIMVKQDYRKKWQDYLEKY